MELNFRESIKYYKSVYYHFLDGYLNPDVGSDLKKFVSLEMSILTNYNGKIIILMDMTELIFPISIDNYIIIQNINNNHATSLLLFKKNDKYYILSFNSGLGINLHKQNDDKFIPYYGVEIDEEKDFNSFVEILSNYQKNFKLFFPEWYVYDDSHYKCIITDENKVEEYVWWEDEEDENDIMT